MDPYVGFGERVGAVTKLALAPNSVPPELRNAVWNLIYSFFAEDMRGVAQVSSPNLLAQIARTKSWLVDSYVGLAQERATKVLKDWLLNRAEWHEIYDFLEQLPRWLNWPESTIDTWATTVSSLLERARSPYRFSGGVLVKLTDDAEVAETSQAAAHVGPYAVAADHMAKALGHFGARPNPDYENAVKEAASAVESALKVATGKSDMSSATRQFATDNNVHPALMESANKLYGYASNRERVRHGGTGDGSPVDFEEAKLVIVSAAALLNFIVSKKGPVR
jgi:hypothetical protein